MLKKIKINRPFGFYRSLNLYRTFNFYRSASFFVFIFAFLIFNFLFFRVSNVQAAVCSENTNLNFVASDPSGAFISNARVTVYTQVIDVNGQPKPGTQVASASTDAVLGTASLSWRRDIASETYAVKVLPSGNNDTASFWYYGEVLDCGGSATMSETLSGILFVLHSSNGNALTNASFKVYSQVYDSIDNPQKQFNQLIISPNSGTSGQVMVYVPQSSVRSRDRIKSDYYALNINRSSQNFNFYDISVSDGQATTLNYFIPSLNVNLQDSTGALFPSGTNVTVFRQEVDVNNLRQAGTQVGSFVLGSGGNGILDIAPGLYVLGIKDKNNVYQYFWDLQVTDGQANNYNLTSKSNQNTPSLTTSCPNNSQLTITLQNASGALISGLKYAVYEQGSDSRGLPVAGTKVNSGTINSIGQANFSFRPDPRKVYALKVWDHQENLGTFWFFSAIRFVCGYDQTLTETIPALHIVLRDSRGQLKRNYSFSLYTQNYDADNRPFFENKDLIANLKTDGGGEATVYVAPYNTYVPNQSGIYALSVRDSNGNNSSFYNIKMPADQDYTYESALSGVNGELRDPQGHALANKDLQLFEELTSSQRLSLGNKLMSLKTSSTGKFGFEYPYGNYALVSFDDFNQQNVFWNLTTRSGNNYQNLINSAVSFSLSNSQGEALADNPSVTLYTLNKNNSGYYFQGQQVDTISLTNGKSILKSLAIGTYLAVYNGLGNRQYGQAFYLKRGEFYAVKINVSSKYLISSNQSFSLPSAALNLVPLSSSASFDSAGNTTNSNNSGNASVNSAAARALATRLQGRILLQVEDKGQAWYVNPDDNKKYALGRPQDAFNIMRRFALGVSNSDFAAIQKNSSAWSRLLGKILIKPEDNGRAYYFDPITKELNYLGRPQDAFNIMRNQGLGITNNDLSNINSGE